jgi:hypothetical protein
MPVRGVKTGAFEKTCPMGEGKILQDLLVVSSVFRELLKIVKGVPYT